MRVQVFGLGLLPPACRKPGLFKRACLAALGTRAGQQGELNLVFTTNPEIRRINRKFLGHDRNTDVIAFLYNSPIRHSGASRNPDKSINLGPGFRRGDEKSFASSPFGDIYVSADQARKQAKELGHTLFRELLTLSIHGALHLSGYDDRTAAQRRRMFDRQDRIASPK